MSKTSKVKWDLARELSKGQVPYAVPARTVAGEEEPAYWERGDAVELAYAMARQVLKLTGAPLVWDLGSFWACGPDKVWRSYEEEAARAWFAPWAGGAVFASRKEGEALKVRKLVINSLKTPGDALRTVVAGTRNTGTGFFREAARGVTFADKFVRVEGRDIKLEAPSWEQRSRYGYDFALEGSGAWQLPVWERYCADAWGEEAEGRSALLGEFIGAAILGVAPKLNRALFLAGVAGSGKSTFIELLEQLVPGEVSHVGPQDFSHEYKPGAMIGARLNTVRDAEGSPIFGEGTVRQVIGGEPLNVNIKYGQPVTFYPEAAHVFGVNDLPQAPGVHAAFWRRFIVVDFTRQHRDTKHEDKQLGAKLVAEREELVRWAVGCGARALQRGDYAIPESCTQAATQWRVEGDSVSYYLDDQCQALEGSALMARELWTEVSKLHQDYTAWCGRSGLKAVGLPVFGRRLKSAEGVESGHASVSRRAIVSVRLK